MKTLVLEAFTAQYKVVDNHRSVDLEAFIEVAVRTVVVSPECIVQIAEFPVDNAKRLALFTVLIMSK